MFLLHAMSKYTHTCDSVETAIPCRIISMYKQQNAQFLMTSSFVAVCMCTPRIRVRVCLHPGDKVEYRCHREVGEKRTIIRFCSCSLCYAQILSVFNERARQKLPLYFQKAFLLGKTATALPRRYPAWGSHITNSMIKCIRPCCL